MTCSTDVPLRTRALVIPNGQTAALRLSAENNTAASITRLLMSANGAGLAGLAGLVVVSVRVGQLYITGGPVMQGLRGAAKTEVAAETLVSLFSRVSLRSPLPLLPGEDLILTLRNESGAARRVVVADNRSAVLQTAVFDRPFAAGPRTTLVTMRATVPASVEDYRIEIPRSTLAGIITDFALTTPTPLEMLVGVSVGRRALIEPTYPEMLERAQDNWAEAGRFYREPIRVGLGETLYLVAASDAGVARTVSFAAEMVHDDMLAFTNGTLP